MEEINTEIDTPEAVETTNIIPLDQSKYEVPVGNLLIQYVNLTNK
ncbi:MAG: hypothetical protein Q9M91_02150 [Candidatus Dojkabacteria bacterium]|nr:hypothetical protein [Candidatus Dojkabacteria bacterium]MDQ7020626.1 hypothetical protein [Candidatus Dojkabacteria bacterium]